MNAITVWKDYWETIGWPPKTEKEEEPDDNAIFFIQVKYQGPFPVSYRYFNFNGQELYPFAL